MIDQTIGSIVINEEQLLGIELEVTSQTQSYHSHIDNGRRTERIVLIQRKLLTITDTLHEVRTLWQRIRELCQSGISHTKLG